MRCAASCAWATCRATARSSAVSPRLASKLPELPLHVGNAGLMLRSSTAGHRRRLRRMMARQQPPRRRHPQECAGVPPLAAAAAMPGRLAEALCRGASGEAAAGGGTVGAGGGTPRSVPPTGGKVGRAERPRWWASPSAGHVPVSKREDEERKVAGQPQANGNFANQP